MRTLPIEKYTLNLEKALADLELEAQPKQQAHGKNPNDFVATDEWQVVPDGAICPAGLHFKMDMTSGQ